MGKIEKDALQSSVSLDTYKTEHLGSFTIDELEKAGVGLGSGFFLWEGQEIAFPKSKKDAYLDAEVFKTSKGDEIPILYGRYHNGSYWDWFPIAVFRRTPCRDYKVTDKDGTIKIVNEEVEYLKDYELGRQLTRSRQSDIQLYEFLVGKRFKVKEVKKYHRPVFKDGKRVDGEFNDTYLYVLEELK